MTTPQIWLLLVLLCTSAVKRTVPSACDRVEMLRRFDAALAEEEGPERLRLLHYANMLVPPGDPMPGPCWFAYKIRTNMAVEHQKLSEIAAAIRWGRIALSGAILASNSDGPGDAGDWVLPALNLADLLLVWTAAEPERLSEADALWSYISQRTSYDRSLRVRSTTQVPYIVPTRGRMEGVMDRLRRGLYILSLDETLDGSWSSVSSPQNLTHWFPTYPLHYHLLDARDTMRIAASISRVYWRCTPSIAWTAPRLRRRALLRTRGTVSEGAASGGSEGTASEGTASEGTTSEDTASESSSVRIRIGFLSKFLFASHSLGKHIRGIIATIDRTKYQVVLIHVGNQRVAYDDVIRVSHPGTTDIDTWISDDLQQLAVSRSRVAELDLGVLVYADIGMEATSYFLSFSRLAPIQIATWCFPASLATGQIDYFISADGLEPDGTSARSHYWEQVVQFRRANPWFFYAEDALPNKAKIPAEYKFEFHSATAPPGSSPWDMSGRHIYLIPQNPIKIHHTMDWALTTLLRRDPLGILVMFHHELLESRFSRGAKESHGRAEGGGGGGGGGGSGSGETHASTFPAGELGHRILLIRRVNQYKFRELLATADVVLDTWPWGGWTTTIQAIAARTPVVTFPGRDARSRFSLHALRSMGPMFEQDLVAHSAKDYVEKALRAGSDEKWQLAFAAGLTDENCSVMLEDKGAPLAWDAFISRAVRLYRQQEALSEN